MDLQDVQEVTNFFERRVSGRSGGRGCPRCGILTAATSGWQCLRRGAPAAGAARADRLDKADPIAILERSPVPLEAGGEEGTRCEPGTAPQR
jgi:hypothetical protein